MTMKAWGRAAAYVGLSVALTGAAVQWAVPAVMERVASAAVISWLGDGRYRVRLEASPRWRLLLGRFDRVEVAGSDLAAPGVGRLVVVLEDVAVDPWALLFGGGLEAPRAGRAAFRIELGERDLAHHLRSRIPFEDLDVSLGSGGFRLEGRLSVGGAATRVEMDGGFAPADAAPHQVALDIRRLRVNGVEVPPFLAEQLLPLILHPGPVVDLAALFPVPVRITAVDAGEGLLIIEGEAEL